MKNKHIVFWNANQGTIESQRKQKTVALVKPAKRLVCQWAEVPVLLNKGK